MRQQVAARDLSERQRLFAEVQQVFGEQLPAIYFVAPKVTLAMAPRVVNANPVPQVPQLLWSADTRWQSVVREDPGNASSFFCRKSRRAPPFALLVLRRAATAVVLVLIVASAALLLARAPWRSPDLFRVDPRLVAGERHRLGLDAPLLTQCSNWIRRLARLDLGESVRYPEGRFSASSPNGLDTVRLWGVQPSSLPHSWAFRSGS